MNAGEKSAMDEAFRSQGVGGVWNFMRDLDLVGLQVIAIDRKDHCCSAVVRVGLLAVAMLWWKRDGIT